MLMTTSPPLKELVPVTPRGEATRKKLLASAEIEFGGKGFPAASVSSITQRADVGQGTFYLYFHSKEEVFATLVRDINAEQCAALAALAPAPGQTAERGVVSLLLDFVAESPGRHRILTEAQFVDAPVFQAEQEKRFAVIARGLAQDRRQASAIELQQRAAALVGASGLAAVEHFQWRGQSGSKGLIEAVAGFG